MSSLSGEQSGGDLSAKEILAIAGVVTAGVGSWVTYMAFFYDEHPNIQRGAPTHLIPDRKAKIVSEKLGAGDEDPSLLLRQTLPDGSTVTVRKPVFVGEVAVHDPGDRVIPSDLEPPLPPQP